MTRLRFYFWAYKHRHYYYWYFDENTGMIHCSCGGRSFNTNIKGAS